MPARRTGQAAAAPAAERLGIRALFCWACDLLGIEWRVMNEWNISVARRESVATLDEFIGPKA